MKKNILTTFVYSFSFSLFVIFATNGLFFREYKNPRNDMDISGKNIALFLKNEPHILGAEVKKVNKIALSVPIKEKEDILEIASVEQKEISLPVTDKPSAPVEPEQSPLKEVYAPKNVALDEISEKNKPIELAKANEKKEIYSPSVEPVKISEDILSAQLLQPDPIYKVPEDTAFSIPIQKDFDPRKSEVGDVKIANTAETSQVALASQDVPLSSLKNEARKVDISTNEVPDDPWVVATGVKNKNNSLGDTINEDMSQEEIKNALSTEAEHVNDKEQVQIAEMAKNILIPIPDEIMNDENLTPQLISSRKDGDSAQEKPIPTETGKPKEEKSSFIGNITSIFKSNSGSGVESSSKDATSDTSKRPIAKILPTEMRLSFQPNKAEISGSTLRWIYAFAKKTNEDSNVLLEIRIDGSSSFDLQQKRLNLLQNILANRGVDPNKVNAVFTTREPNSFIVRTVRINETEKEQRRKMEERASSPYYQRW